MWEKLLEEINKGNPAEAEKTINQMSVDDLTRDYSTLGYDQLPFHRAVERGYEGVVQLLLAKKPDLLNSVDKNGEIPLMRAGQLEIARLLITKGATLNHTGNEGQTPLLWAAGTGNVEIVQLMLDKGASINQPNKIGFTPLMQGAHGGHLKVVLLLLDKGAPVNHTDNNGETALMQAAYDGRLEVAKLLLDRGASVNHSATNGHTPLMKAVDSGSIEVMKLLIDKGATVNYTNNSGLTPFMWAASHGVVEAMKLLLNRGAKLNQTDSTGRTALHYAVNTQPASERAVDYLLDIDPNMISTADNSGNTVLHIAASNGINLLAGIPSFHMFISVLRLKDKATNDPAIEQWLNNSITTFDTEISKNPQVADNYYKKGNILCALNRKEESDKCFEKTIELDPKYIGKLILNINRSLVGVDQNGQPPFNMASLSGYDKTVEILFGKTDEKVINSLDPKVINQTLLNMVKANNKNGISMLVSKMSSKNISLQDELGKTPLHWAVQYGYDEIISILLSRMSPDEVSIRDIIGKSVWDLCPNFNILKMVEHKLGEEWVSRISGRKDKAELDKTIEKTAQLETRLQSTEKKLEAIVEAKALKLEKERCTKAQEEAEKAAKAQERKKVKSVEEINEVYDPELKSLGILFIKSDTTPGTNHDETIRQISELIREGNDRLQEGGDKAILIVGNTMAGKSTLANIISGMRMQAILNEQTAQLVIETIQSTQNIEIGHDMRSWTRIPNRCTVENDNIYHKVFTVPNKFFAGTLIIWDCPGFYDTNVVQEIANSFYIKRLFEINGHLRLILMVPESDIIEARGNHFIDTIDSFMKCFKDLKVPIAHTSLVISKVKPRRNSVHVKNFIDMILDKNERITKNEQKKLLISKLKENLTLFYRPKDEGEILSLGEDLQNLINPLADYSKSSDYMVNMGISPEANERSKQLLTTALNNFNKIIKVVALAVANPNKCLKHGHDNLFIENYDLIKDWIPSKMDHQKWIVTDKTGVYFFHLDHLSLLDKLLSNSNIQSMTEGIAKLRKIIDSFEEYTQGTVELKHQIQNYGYVLSQQYEYIRFFSEICKEKLPDHQGLQNILSECHQKVKRNLEYQIKSMTIDENEDNVVYYEKAIEYLDHYKDSSICKILKAKSYCSLAGIAENQNNISEALKYYVKAIESNRELEPFQYNKIGSLFYNMGEYGKAIECYKVVNNSYRVQECFKLWLNSDPENTHIILAKAQYLESIGLFDKAKSSYYKASSLIENVDTKADIWKKIASIMTGVSTLAESVREKAEHHDFCNYDMVNAEFINSLMVDLPSGTGLHGQKQIIYPLKSVYN